MSRSTMRFAAATRQVSTVRGRNARSRFLVSKAHSVRPSSPLQPAAQAMANFLHTVRKFDNRQDADDFVAGKTPKNKGPDPKKPPKFYAVAIGREPGIYTDWTEAQKAFVGWKGVKQQSFKTRADAVEYIKIHGGEAGQKAIENEVSEPPTKKSKTVQTGVLQAFTDGSSRGNGRVGASAGVGVFFGEDDKRFVSIEARSFEDQLIDHFSGTSASASRGTRRPTNAPN